ncbi:filamentous hemagglutinin N-terminal domain-containing protein [Orbus wheelerorum]|uniref:two-partner secretion domain-containing protein n=1 Tax=Orbus wheelerorum TaxID=3074111 RepID=UPI00370DBD94
MNKHFYRLIFNKARGMVMVVAEIVKRHQGEGRSSQKAKASLSLDKKMTAALKPLSFLTFVALGMVSVVAQSNANTIIADKSANKSQQASIIDRANGPTVVNIQEANQAGVSHNKYTQFDVSKEGVILNNNAQSSNTTLGGNIAGNSNLASSGGAKVILNEINSQNASQLNGRIEVAGQKAQVVIANAAGITCNGCGFINADRATLTTGKLIIGEDGKLNGYQVEQGNITINGAFDSSQQDYTDLIARAVNINDKIQAKNLTVIAGKNKVSHDLQTIDKLASNDTKPELAIDVAALGGMYAGKIKLVSTEGGVGVRNAGTIGSESTTESINITADGKVINLGTIGSTTGSSTDYSNQDININSTEDIIHDGSINGKNVNLASKQSINSSNNIFAKNDVIIQADKDVNTGHYIDAENNLDITAGGKITIGNWLWATNNTNLNGKQGIDFNSTFFYGSNISLVSEQTINFYDAELGALNKLSILANYVHNAGHLAAAQEFTITTDGQFFNSGKLGDGAYYDELGEHYLNSDVNITSLQGIDNQGSISGKTINLVSQQTINNDGSISAEHISLESKHTGTENYVGMRNAGTIGSESTTESINITSDGKVINLKQIGSGGYADKASNQVINITSSQDIANNGWITGLDVNLVSKQSIDGMDGYIGAKNDIILQADKDVNTGYFIEAEHNLNVTADSKITTGRWMNGNSKGNTYLNGKQGIDFNSMIITSNANLISEQTINFSDGFIQAINNLNVQAHNVYNTMELAAGQEFTIITDGQFVNSGKLGGIFYEDELYDKSGKAYLNSDVNITSLQGIDNQGSISGKTINLVSQQTINNDGSISAEHINLESKHTGTENYVGVRNAGTIGSESTTESINITSDGKVINLKQIGGRAFDSDGVNQNIYINSLQDIVNDDTIVGQNINLVSGQSINNGDFYILAGNNMTMQAGKDVNTGYYSGATNELNITADGKITAGRWLAGGVNTYLNGKQGIDFNSMLVNSNTTLISEQTINFLDGFINTDNKLNIQAHDVNINNDIILTAGKELSINADGQFVNFGALGSEFDYDELGNPYVNPDLEVNTNININSLQGIDNQGLIHGKNINLASKQTINNDGVISADGSLNLLASDVINTNSLQAIGDLAIFAAGKIDNKGSINADQNVSLAVNTLNNDNRGTIHSYGNLNVGAEIDDNGQVIGKASAINNISSTMSAGGDLTINADKINNTIKTIDVIAEDIDIKEWSFKSADDKRYNADKITVDNDDIDSDVSHLKIIGTDKDSTEYNYYDYNQKTYIVDVLDAQSAQMISGGNMTLSANTIINDHSEINAGKTLSTSVGISNYIFDYNTVRKVIKKGTKEYTHDVYDSNGHHFSQTDSSDYNVNFYKWKFKW